MSKWVRHKRKDGNHHEIVGYLRDQGAIVEDVSDQAGLGYDIIVIFMGQTAFVEIKDGSKPPSAIILTESECKARDRLGRMYFVVKDEIDCDVMLGLLRGVER